MNLTQFACLCLFLLTVPVFSDELQLRYLLRQKTNLGLQMESQVSQTRSAVSRNKADQLIKLIADIGEAHEFAVEETDILADYMSHFSASCLAGVPVTIDEILVNAEGLLTSCVPTVVEVADTIEASHLDDFEGFRNTANDLNLLFARDYFKSPEMVFTTAMFQEQVEAMRNKAILWDNVDNVDVFFKRTEHASQSKAIDDALNKCIMDMKEYVATEFGRIFLYSWGC